MQLLLLLYYYNVNNSKNNHCMYFALVIFNQSNHIYSCRVFIWKKFLELLDCKHKVKKGCHKCAIISPYLY